MAVLRGEPSPYEFPDDKHGGFEAAVRNNQPNMAMHYLVLIIDELNEKLEKLEEKVDGHQGAVSEVPKRATEKTETPEETPAVAAKKATTKKAATKKREKKEEDLVHGNDA